MNPLDQWSAIVRVGACIVELKANAGHQELFIDGKPERYWVGSRGYTLYSNAYAPAAPSLLAAVAALVGSNKITLLSHRHGDAVSTSPVPDDAVGASPVFCARPDFMAMNEGSREELAAALNALWESGVVRSFAQEHSDAWFRVHFGPAFLPWHRHFLLRFERQLQQVNPRVHLPYWDWTRTDSWNLDAGPWKSFFGGRANLGGKFDEWRVEDGGFDRGERPGDSGEHDHGVDDVPEDTADRQPTVLTMAWYLDRPSFAAFREIENAAHRVAHQFVGGTMMTPYSPADPLFYLHHCNVDRLWAYWQKLHPDADQYNLGSADVDDSDYSSRIPVDELMAGGATPRSMLDHSELGIIYPGDKRLETTFMARTARTTDDIDDDGVGPAIEVGRNPVEIFDPEVVPPLSLADSTRRLHVMPASLSFGLVPAGGLEGRRLVIRNAGTRSVRLEVPAGEGSFRWHAVAGFVRPCRSLELTVFFRPQAPGPATTRLTVTSDADNGPHEVVLTGRGIEGSPQ